MYIVYSRGVSLMVAFFFSHLLHIPVFFIPFLILFTCTLPHYHLVYFYGGAPFAEKKFRPTDLQTLVKYKKVTKYKYGNIWGKFKFSLEMYAMPPLSICSVKQPMVSWLLLAGNIGLLRKIKVTRDQQKDARWWTTHFSVSNKDWPTLLYTLNFFLSKTIICALIDYFELCPKNVCLISIFLLT